MTENGSRGGGGGDGGDGDDGVVHAADLAPGHSRARRKRTPPTTPACTRRPVARRWPAGGTSPNTGTRRTRTRWSTNSSSADSSSISNSMRPRPWNTSCAPRRRSRLPRRCRRSVKSGCRARSIRQRYTREREERAIALLTTRPDPLPFSDSESFLVAVELTKCENRFKIYIFFGRVSPEKK